MERRKLTKEDLDKVRHIEGFPIAKDEDIIALSDAPNYTACPNPFIEDFIRENGTPYDEATDDYQCGPYTDDISEDKHDLIYNIHSYHTKVPPKAIITFIEHYTKPGDIVLDVFSGSGMTGIAAQTCSTGKRKAILVDLSPYATFLSKNYNTPNSNSIITSIKENLQLLHNEFDSVYQTNHLVNGNAQISFTNDTVKGVINYTIWSDVLFCPHCGYEMIYYKVALDPETKKAKKSFKCVNCNYEITKSNMVLKQVSEEAPDGTVIEHALKVPVLINYSIGTKRFFKEPDENDLNTIGKCRPQFWIPTDELPKGYNTEQPRHSHNLNSVSSFYPKRVLAVLSRAYDLFDSDIKKKFLFTSVLPKLTFLNRYMPEHGSRALVGPMAGTLYVPSLSVENNVLNQLEFQLQKLNHLTYEAGECFVSTQSATSLDNIPSNSIDYIFIDPPFGANIMYSELNFLPESWLKVKTNNKEEAIINTIQGKALPEYTQLMSNSFSSLYRVLKPNRWITIEFHNSKNAVWNSIQQSIQAAGFIIADVRTLSKEKKTVMQYNSANTVDQDLVISAYKPKDSFVRQFELKSGSIDAVWSFVTQHLSNLPVVVKDADKIEIIDERQRYLLFDRMVSYHIMREVSVPLDATEFYRGLDEHYLQRDGMYFLADQVNEYDTQRILCDIEPVQLSFIVSNEKTAIAWLYQQLEIPQTYADIQPKFMQEIRTIDKHEAMPELSVLLEENFLQDDQGKWYIPDITKEADISKLREKSLLKEFDGYLATKGKLKLFRTEAIRVGFAKLWKDKNYKLIVETAERLPEQIIQEDDKLLMYYDISLGRV